MRRAFVVSMLLGAFAIVCIYYPVFIYQTKLKLEPDEHHLDEEGNNLTHLHDNSAGPSLEHEVARRKVDRVSLEFWTFLRSELKKLLSQTKDNTTLKAINELLTKSSDYQTTLLFGLMLCKYAASNIFEFSHYTDVLSRTCEYETVETKIRMLRFDFDKLATGVDNLTDWRLQESFKVGHLVQRRLDYLQNPKDCSTAKILLCQHPTDCGYACQLHHQTFCLLMAYATNRTLVLKEPAWTHFKNKNMTEPFFQPLSKNCTEYNQTGMKRWTADGKHDHLQTMTIHPNIQPRPVTLPPAVPADLADRLVRFHDNPSVWWIGQFVKYLTRPRKNLERFYVNKEQSSGFELPIVGVHIRRTDKIPEAQYHNVEEYMMYVEEWFNMYATRHPGTKRRVYLASDEPGVLKEAQKKYSNYIFIVDAEVAKSAKYPNKRFTETSLYGILQDIHLLSLCNFVVCTFSSNVCRAVYETMQTMHGDASNYVKSLDSMYFFHGQNSHIVKAVEAHNRTDDKTIELLPGDRIRIGGNNWNGYSSGTNERTGKKGLFPSYKTVDTVVKVKMPTYPEVEDIP